MTSSGSFAVNFDQRGAKLGGREVLVVDLDAGRLLEAGHVTLGLIDRGGPRREVDRLARLRERGARQRRDQGHRGGGSRALHQRAPR